MIVLLLIFLILLIHYGYFLLKILIGLRKLSPSVMNGNSHHFISVIIPFRNESENILKSLRSIEGLNYPEEKFEVIYVDDNSTDDSFELAESGKTKSNISVLRLPFEAAGRGNKKYAIQYGIDNSKGDIIVTTDSDCIHHKNWLQNIIRCFDSRTAFVAGPVAFTRRTGLFSELQELEFEGLILAGAGLIGAGSPVICNGANIAYRKEVFKEVEGLNDNLNLSSGDDEFLMQKISSQTDYLVKFCAEREAVVLTDSNTNLGDFFSQRKRWASKSLFYKDRGLIIQLVLIFLFYSGLFVQTFLILAGHYEFLITLVFSLVIKILPEYLIIKKGEQLFFSRKKNSVFVITEILQVPYIIITAFAGLFGSFTWKGRNIKR